MNLYRSFGNLMEVWVAEEEPCSDIDWFGKSDYSDMGANQRSESVDSGVETASCDTFLSTSCSVSPDNVEITPFLPQKERLPQASTSLSPVLSFPLSSSSSSSSHVCPIRAAKGPSALHLKLEQALQRTDSMQLKDKGKWLRGDEELGQRPQASCVPKRHASELVRRPKNGYFGQKRTTVNPACPTRQMSDLCRRPPSRSYNKQTSEDPDIAEKEELSPGFCYLKQVCQMLEDIARQQILNQSLQPEMDALKENEDEQASNSQNDSTSSREALSLCQGLENTKNAEDISSKRLGKYGHLRQRSMSDTALSTLHLRKLNLEGGVQIVSTNDLTERDEEEQEDQMPRKKTNSNWKLKLGSLGRVESTFFNTKSQKTQSSEKNSARRRVSQLFKKKKTPSA